MFLKIFFNIFSKGLVKVFTPELFGPVKNTLQLRFLNSTVCLGLCESSNSGADYSSWCKISVKRQSYKWTPESFVRATNVMRPWSDPVPIACSTVIIIFAWYMAQNNCYNYEDMQIPFWIAWHIPKENMLSCLCLQKWRDLWPMNGQQFSHDFSLIDFGLIDILPVWHQTKQEGNHTKVCQLIKWFGPEPTKYRCVYVW